MAGASARATASRTATWQIWRRVTVGVMVLTTAGIIYRSTRPQARISLRAFFETTAPLTKGFVNPLMHSQGLSHQAFHSPVVQQALVHPFAPPNTVAIVGMEYGNDVVHFANAGYNVLAFEPVPKFLQHVTSIIERHPDWNVTVHPIAAGNSTSTITLKYQKNVKEERVSQRRLDDVIDEPIAVLSADVQGEEYSVLQGAERLLKKSVSSVWVESFSCNDRVLKLMEMLDEDFVFFDFVPWGKPLSQAKETEPFLRENYKFVPDRPGRFDLWVNWLCQSRRKDFQILQTDLLGVRRDLVHSVMPLLSTIGERACAARSARCFLRKLLKL